MAIVRPIREALPSFRKMLISWGFEACKLNRMEGEVQFPEWILEIKPRRPDETDAWVGR
jgi:hypothetical protein